MFNNVVRSIYIILLIISVLYGIYCTKGVIEILMKHNLTLSAVYSFQPHSSCKIFHITR